jgi:PAS domain S-box-containing protein
MLTLRLLLVFAAAICVPALAASESSIPDEPLVVVYSPIGPPLIFDDGQGQPDGLLIDFWRHIGEHLGRELRFELASWPQGLQMVRDGRADAHAGLFRTEERQAYLAFSQPLLEIEARLFVPAETAWQGIEDVGAARIGVIAGSHIADVLPTLNEQPDYWHFVDPDAMVRAAVDGRLEAFVMSAPAARFHLHRYGAEARFRSLQPVLIQWLHAAVARDEDPALIEAIERAIAALEPEQRQHLVSYWHGLVDQPEVPGWLWPVFGAALAAVLILSLLVYSVLLRLRVAAATRQSEQGRQQLAMLLDNLPISVVTHDAGSGELLSANQRALEAHGVNSFEALRDERRWGEPPHSCQEAGQWLNRAMENGPQRLEWRAVRHDGSSYWEEILLQPMFRNGEQIVVAAAVDITAHKHMEYMQRSFIRAMAHELRTPLAIIETALANLRLQIGERMPELGPRLDRIDRSVLRLNLVAARALAVDLSEADHVAPHPGPCRPSELLEQVLAMFDHDPTSHPLKTELPADDSPLSLDRHWLGIAILNLLDNAVKYSPDGGEVGLTMSRTNGTLRICVADRGPGIDPDHRQHLFDRFYRASSTSQVRGMGIGLYLVSLIANLHGGWVGVEDHAGGGSRFVLEVSSLAGDS